MAAARCLLFAATLAVAASAAWAQPFEFKRVWNPSQQEAAQREADNYTGLVFNFETAKVELFTGSRLLSLDCYGCRWDMCETWNHVDLPNLPSVQFHRFKRIPNAQVLICDFLPLQKTDGGTPNGSLKCVCRLSE